MWIDKEELHKKQEDDAIKDVQEGRIQCSSGDIRDCICYYNEVYWWEKAYNWIRKLFGLKPVVWW